MLEVFSAKRVRALQSIREEEVNTLVQTTMRQSSSDPVNFFASCLFASLTISSVDESSAGGFRVTESARAADTTISLLGGFVLGYLFPRMEWLDVLAGTRARLERNFRAMDELLEEEMEKRMHGGGNCDDLMSILLGLRKDSNSRIHVDRVSH